MPIFIANWQPRQPCLLAAAGNLIMPYTTLCHMSANQNWNAIKHRQAQGVGFELSKGAHWANCKFNNRIVHEGCQSSMLGKHMECEQTVWATVLTARRQIKLQLPERAKRNRKLISLVPVCMTENHCLLSGAAHKMNKLLHDLLSIKKYNWFSFEKPVLIVDCKLI